MWPNYSSRLFVQVSSTTEYSSHSSAVVIGTCLMMTFFAISSAIANESYWSDIGQNITSHIDNAESLYAGGDSKGAKRAVIQAYFGEFEDRKMEAAMRTELGAKHTYKVERLFGDLRKAITTGADQAVIADLAMAIRTAIKRDALALDKAGIPPDVFKVNQ